MKVPLRGQVWLADLGMIAKVRPVLVLSGVFNIQGSQSVPRSNLLRALGTLTGEQLVPVEESFRRWLQL